jgi:hypothetical protein
VHKIVNKRQNSYPSKAYTLVNYNVFEHIKNEMRFSSRHFSALKCIISTAV